MPDLPAHASPALSASDQPPPSSVTSTSSSSPSHPPSSDAATATSTMTTTTTTTTTSATPSMTGLSLPSPHPHIPHPTTPSAAHPAPPPSLLSPAFTPPGTPGGSISISSAHPHGIPINDDDDAATRAAPTPALLDRLPTVECQVRARIPTTGGTEMFLHLYRNDVDDKEHLAIVFGGGIRSRSLDRPRPGETEMDRMIRGAYTGRLWPGRASSREEGGAGQGNGVEGRAEEVVGEGEKEEPPLNHLPLVRIHSECYTGETVWSARCDCGEQLDEAAKLMSDPTTAPRGGVIVYLRQEGRGIGLGEKLKAYNLQDLGSDTYEANLLLRHPADARSYGLATAVLVDLGLGGAPGIRLLTNNPDKVRAVEGPGREVLVRERVPMIPKAWVTGGREGVRSQEVERYLATKIEKFKHMLTPS